MDLRVAVVTGSNKGIGFALVRRMCKEFNGRVYLTARSEERGREAVSRLEAEGLKPSFHQLDIDSPESIENLRRYLQDTYGGLDVLVNNAGVAYSKYSSVPFPEQAANSVRTNFTGTLNVSKALIPLIRSHGRVCNVSSSICGTVKTLLKTEALQKQFSSPVLTECELVTLMEQFVTDVASGIHAENGWATSALGVSKLGLTALTKIHSREMAAVSGQEDVLVNACCPGWVKTEMSGSLPQATLTPDEGAEMPLFLATLLSGSPTGEFWKKKAVAEW